MPDATAGTAPPVRAAAELDRLAVVTDDDVTEARDLLVDAVALALLAAVLWREGKRLRSGQYAWDGDEGVFRDDAGDAVSDDVVLAALSAAVDPLRADVRAAADSLAAGSVDLPGFASTLERASLLGLVIAGALAAGGWRRYGTQPRRQTAERYRGELDFSENFIHEIARRGVPPVPPAGTERESAAATPSVESSPSLDAPLAPATAERPFSAAEIGARAEQYVDASHRALVGDQRAGLIARLGDDAGEWEEMRTLHSVQPCAQCPTYAGRWEPLGTLPEVGQSCDCAVRCRCEFSYRRRQAAMSKATTAPELSHDDVRRLLSTAIRSVMPRQTSIYVEDVYPDYVIYRDYDAEASYRRDYTLDANGSVTLGDAAEVMQRTVYDTVQMAAFSLDSSTDTAAGVPWKGPIFRAGDYPDKGLSISTAELDAAVGAFAPVPLNVEHKDSIFSGSFGELSKVWREGEELFGEITTPSWFKTDVVGGKRLSVSTEWDVAAKRLTGLATALNPRVTGAEVVAVFSKAEAHFVGKRNSSADATKIQSIHDNAAKLGAECGGKEKANMSQEQVQTPKPSIGDRFKAFFGLLTPEERKELGLPEQAATVTAIQPHVLEMSTATLSAGPSQREKDLEAEIARLKGDKKATIAADAAAFAAEQINAGKATPADRDAIVARFSEAAEDDVDLARRVTFSVGGETKEGTRVERLRAEFTAREGHGLLTERAGQEGVQVLMSTGTSGAPGEATTEQVHALLKLTPTGASALRLATK